MIRIISPRASYVQFGTQVIEEGCGYEPFVNALPVYLDDDIAFQFVLEGDTKSETDALCDLHNAKLTIGISSAYGGAFLTTFAFKTERYRLSDTQVSYNWTRGLPGFTAFIEPGRCFVMKISIDSGEEFYSNLFERLREDCYTAVVEYGSDDDTFGFNYCNSSPLDSDAQDVCQPLFITFTDQASIAIPYTASLRDKYGLIPTVKVWFLRDDGTYYDAGVRVDYDNIPPSLISVNLGGTGSGVVKIS